MAIRREPDPIQAACVIYHGGSFEPDTRYARWRHAEDLLANGPGDEPTVLIVDRSMLERRDRLRRLPRRVVLVAADETVEDTLGRRCPISLAGLHEDLSRRRMIHCACLLACARLAGVRLRRRLARQKAESRELNRIGMSLMMEPDRAELLRQIVRQGKRLTASDSGALLLLETGQDGTQYLRPVFWDFDFLPDLRVPPTTYPLDGSSVPGFAAMSRRPLVVDDVYHLPADAPFQHDRTLDEMYGYHTKSGLIVPMIDHRDHVVGVLALGNRKSDPSARITSKETADRYVLRYTDREVQLARSLAGQAAVSVENHQLYERIEQMLDGFVRAAVTAIDARDPATAGHSLRVARLAMSMALAVARSDRAPYRGVRFTRAQMRELGFAALVHDVGKVTVREDVLMKAKKLPPVLWERVGARFELIRRTLQLEHCARQAPKEALTAELERVEQAWQVVAAANEPGGKPSPALTEIAARTFERFDGSRSPYLTPEELHFLQISRGTLDEDERAEVESHVDEARAFLENVPLTDDLKNAVDYACDHHEKLDGSGYPNHLTADRIPLQARLITLADMFDALTEADRPYKPAMPAEVALDILRSEAKAGKLDHDLVEIMIESKAYETATDGVGFEPTLGF